MHCFSFFVCVCERKSLLRECMHRFFCLVSVLFAERVF